MDELKNMKIWVCFKLSYSEGKAKKIPVSVTGGKTGTSKEYKETWVTYSEAANAAKRNHFAGVMFIVPEGYAFIDIDHHSPEDPFVREIISTFNTYAEVSFSGNGIHLYCKCDSAGMPATGSENHERRLDSRYYVKNPHNDLEIYIGGLTNRGAVFTGKVIKGYEKVRNCTESLLTVLNRYMLRPEPAAMTPSPQCRDACTVSPDDIALAICRQKNGEKFRELYYYGNTSSYKSHSEADLALCSMIAFRVGPDEAVIDQVFRKSALYREKWERRDYRTSTIKAGISSCHGTFYTAPSQTRCESPEPGQSKPPAVRDTLKHIAARPPFILENKYGEYVSAPLLAKYIRETERFILVRDGGKQSLMVFVYEKQAGCYRYYSKDMMYGLIKRPVIHYCENLLKMQTISEAYLNLTTDINYISQDDLNADEDLINFMNCTVRISDHEISVVPHSPDVLSTIQIPCNWIVDPIPTPVFDDYLTTLTGNDEDVMNLLLEVLGVCISNVKGWRMKKALFLVGDGDTGKSVLKSLAERLLGKGNYIGIDLREIEARFGTGTIYGTRLAGSSDMGFMSVEELRTFKKITGGDALFAEFKSQQGFTFVYNGFLWFCTNQLPRFGGDDGQWVYDRIMVVNCPNVIPKDKQDKDLLNKLYAERDGIIQKAVFALQNVIRNGYRFSEPRSILDARRSYVKTNSTIISFIDECMEKRESEDSCTTGVIYNVYCEWCRYNNKGFSKSSREFRKVLAEYLGVNTDELISHKRGGNYYPLTLTSEAKNQYRHIINRSL